jgi:beta-glucanase (GH16 family)
MKYIDIKTIDGNCGGFGSWIGNALSSPAPGNILYYKTPHHSHHSHHSQRGGSSSRTKSRKSKTKSKTKTKSKLKSKTKSKKRRNIRRNRKY